MQNSIKKKIKKATHTILGEILTRCYGWGKKSTN